MHIIMSSRKILSALFATSVSMIMVSASTLFAQAPYQYDVGSVNSCNASGTSTINSGELSADVPYTGVGTFETRSNSENPTSTTLKVVSFYGSGTDPVLGKVIWELAPSEGLESTITANQADAALPATGRLVFNAQITVDSDPEALYVSDTPVIMVGTISEWPHNNAQYSQEGVVTFTNVNDPSQTMSVPAMTGTMNAVQ
jgi:hypothetical protein